LIPGENDTPEELSGIARFIAGVNKDIPWHISGFHADYKFTGYSSTSESTLKQAYNLGRSQGLRYVYAGNVRGWGQDTICSGCQKPIIKREGFKVAEIHIAGDRCAFCQTILPGVFISD
jgi:pyruvate formate lyase activating enzyme